MPRITISYRREDSGVITGRIFDRLVVRYGRDAIFRDIDNVPFGVDFRTHIDQVLGASDVVVAVVGPQWAGPAGSPSRLGDTVDPVRVEIETALRKGVPLIPVLVLGAAMPAGDQLPESLKDFAYRNAVQLDAGQDFDVHMARVIRAIDGVLGLTVEVARASAGETAPAVLQLQPAKRLGVLIGGSLAAILVVAVGAGWYFGFDRQKPPPVAVATPVAAPPAPAVDPELVFWQSVENSSSAADFDEYLRKFPDGRFAGLARNRLASLQVPAPAPAPPPSPTVPVGPAGADVASPARPQAPDRLQPAPGPPVIKPAGPPQPRPRRLPEPAPTAVAAPTPVPKEALANPFDGSYTGTVTAAASVGEGGHNNCRNGGPVQMKIIRGAVIIRQARSDGEVVGYSGTVDARGSVTASHTGFDGFVFSAFGSISQNRFAGQIRRRGCYFTVDLARG